MITVYEWVKPVQITAQPNQTKLCLQYPVVTNDWSTKFKFEN